MYQALEQLQGSLERALQTGNLEQQAEIYLQIADDHFEHSNLFLAQHNFDIALSKSTQVNNLPWVRQAHSGLGQILAESGHKDVIVFV